MSPHYSTLIRRSPLFPRLTAEEIEAYRGEKGLRRADNNITYKFCISFIYSHPFIVNNLFSSSVTPRRRREPVGRYARRTRHE